jgi:hypothetical protein
MESPERMPIACVHCAKAKAKCDKKVSRAPKPHTTEEADMEVNDMTVQPAVAHLLARQSGLGLLLSASVENNAD